MGAKYSDRGPRSGAKHYKDVVLFETVHINIVGTHIKLGVSAENSPNYIQALLAGAGFLQTN